MATKKKKKQRRATRSRPSANIEIAEAVSVTSPGKINLPDAPGGYRQLLRYSQLSIGTAGVDRNISDVWATFLDDMKDLGVPDPAIERMRRLGPDKVLGGGSKRGFNKSITALLDEPQLKQMRLSLVQARNAVRGVPDTVLSSEMDQLINIMSKDPQFQTPEGRRILAEIKKPENRKLLAKVGANQGMSVLSRRGDDPWWTQKFNQLFKRKNTAVLPDEFQDLVKRAGKGTIAAPLTKATKSAMAAGGAAGTSLLGGAGRKALGMLGKTAGGALGIGALAYFEGSRMIDILGRPARAEKMARTGYEGLGGNTSVGYLRKQIADQELVARRKLTMQKYEPEMWHEMIRTLSQSGQRQPTLTQTERRIGARKEMGAAQTGRSKEEMTFLLDQMFNQMGSGG